MSTQAAELEPLIAQDGGETPVSGGQHNEPERPLAVARGIIAAILLSIPLWALVAFALYLLI